MLFVSVCVFVGLALCSSAGGDDAAAAVVVAGCFADSCLLVFVEKHFN
jgi:hypothetical protein